MNKLLDKECLLVDLSYLKVYRCKAYVTILKERRGPHSKFSSRAYVGKLVRYIGTSIYKIWLSERGGVVKTSHVTFDEAIIKTPIAVRAHRSVIDDDAEDIDIIDSVKLNEADNFNDTLEFIYRESPPAEHDFELYSASKDFFSLLSSVSSSLSRADVGHREEGVSGNATPGRQQGHSQNQQYRGATHNGDDNNVHQQEQRQQLPPSNQGRRGILIFDQTTEQTLELLPVTAPSESEWSGTSVQQKAEKVEEAEELENNKLANLPVTIKGKKRRSSSTPSAESLRRSARM